jgi:hypothetical protein
MNTATNLRGRKILVISYMDVELLADEEGLSYMELVCFSESS